MAIVLGIIARGSEINTPWAELSPDASSGGATIARLAHAAGFRSDFVYEIESNGTFTLDEGSSTPTVSMLIGPYQYTDVEGGGSIIPGYAWCWLIDNEFATYDDDRQENALSTAMTVTVGGVSYSVAAIDTGIVFFSDLAVEAGENHFYMLFHDSRSGNANILGNLYNALKVT